MFGKIKRSFSKNTALEDLAHQIVLLAQDGAHDVVAANVHFKLVEQQAQAFAQAIGKVHSTGLGDEISRLDEQRDRMYHVLREVIWGFYRFEEGRLFASASLLYEIFKARGGIVDLTYGQESSMLRGLIEDCQSEQAQAALQALQLDEAFGTLVKLQARFDAIFIEKSNRVKALKEHPSATSLRPALISAIRDLLSFAQLSQTVDAQWRDYIDTLYARFPQLK